MWQSRRAEAHWQTLRPQGWCTSRQDALAGGNASIQQLRAEKQVYSVSEPLKQVGQLFGSQLIKIIRNGTVPLQQAKAPPGWDGEFCLIQRNHAHHRLAGFADHKRLLNRSFIHLV